MEPDTERAVYNIQDYVVGTVANRSSLKTDFCGWSWRSKERTPSETTRIPAMSVCTLIDLVVGISSRAGTTKELLVNLRSSGFSRPGLHMKSPMSDGHPTVFQGLHIALSKLRPWYKRNFPLKTVHASHPTIAT